MHAAAMAVLRRTVLLLGLMILLEISAPCHARSSRSLSAKQKAAVVKQVPGVVVSFKEVKPTLSSMWIPSIKSDQASVQVPVAGSPGTPSTADTMSRIQYTVTYAKRPSHILTGTLTVGSAAFSSSDSGAEGKPYNLHTPNITISQKGIKKPQQIPAQGIKCTSYTLEPGSSVTCSFRAQVFSFLDTPPPGTVRASVQLSGGGLQSNKPVRIQTPKSAFEWPVAVSSSSTSSSGAEVGEAEGIIPANSNMRLSGADTAQQFLQETMQSSGGPSSSSGSSSSATVTNYFEPGEGRVLPKGVQGKQPAANSVLEETASFTYVALIPDLPKDACDQPLQVVNSATVEKTSDGMQQPETDISTVDIVPVGCGGELAAAATPAVAPATAAAGPAGPVLQRPGDAPQLLEGSAPAGAAPAASSSATAVAVAAAAPAADAVPILIPPGVLLAVTGSRLCGPTSLCGPGQMCVDNLFCCDPGSTRCGNGCCPSGHICSGGMCLPPGTVACGGRYCPAGLACMGGRCCGAEMVPCGATCCNWGEICQLGMCLPPGAQLCGGTVCPAFSTCVMPGVCCHAGETVCGAACCGAGMQCLNGQCVAAGSTQCAGQICGPGTVCSSGAMCCPVGHEFCGGTCCGGGASSCISGRCIPLGHQVCGSQICTDTQICAGGSLCCNQGETVCAGACCGTGTTCINNLCVPLGSQPCGMVTCPIPSYCADISRQLCCPQGRRACSGTCCPEHHGCNAQGLCVPIDALVGGAIVAEGGNRPWGGDGGWGHGQQQRLQQQQTPGKPDAPTVVNNVDIKIAT